jgi:hypothetical protein
MQCHEFEERMQALLDERRLPQSDARLLAHARSCAECSQWLLAQELLFRSLGRALSPAPSGDFAERVLCQVEAQPDWRRRGTPGRVWLAAGVAATIAAVALLALSLALNRGPGKPARGLITAPTRATAESVPAPSLAVGNGPNRAPIDSALPLVTGRQQTASPIGASSDVESFEQYSQAIQSLASQVTPERLDEVEEATPGLRPVKTSFSLAIGTIRRTIPPPRKTAPPRKPAKRDSSWLWAIGDYSV